MQQIEQKEIHQKTPRRPLLLLSPAAARPLQDPLGRCCGGRGLWRKMQDRKETQDEDRMEGVYVRKMMDTRTEEMVRVVGADCCCL